MQVAPLLVGPTAMPTPPPGLLMNAHTGDPIGAAVEQLLARGHSLPCSTAAQAFQQMVQPTLRFQLALDVLLPILSSPRSEVRHRS